MDVAQVSVATLFSGNTTKDTILSSFQPDLDIHPGNASEPFSPITVPSTQRAIVTREVGKALNMSLQTIPMREPVPGEVVLRTLYSGICCSVSANGVQTLLAFDG
jgi:hypothetical protein